MSDQEICCVRELKVGDHVDLEADAVLDPYKDDWRLEAEYYRVKAIEPEEDLGEKGFRITFITFVECVNEDDERSDWFHATHLMRKIHIS